MVDHDQKPFDPIISSFLWVDISLSVNGNDATTTERTSEMLKSPN